VRIFWQSFVDQATSAPYMARLAAYLNEIAAPGTSVHVEGITPADRDFGRLSEFRCAIQAVDNGLAAQESGFDAYVMGHFQDPGLYELRSALTIPVVGTARRRCWRPRSLGGGSALSRSIQLSRSGITSRPIATGFPAAWRMSPGWAAVRRISAPRLQAMRRRKRAC
jgi:hypothetical protein